LAIHANTRVNVDALVDELWCDHPPASAVANVRGYAGGLRREFGSLPGCASGQRHRALAQLNAVRHISRAGPRGPLCQAMLIATEVHLRRGDVGDAARQAEAALSLARRCRYAYAEATALRQYAKALAAAGQRNRANALFAEAATAYAALAESRTPDPVIESVLTQTDPAVAGASR
jgi:hypothetical protein